MSKLVRYQHCGCFHFVTFSCYRRQPLLDSAVAYYANGNVDTANDFVTGNWTYTYDTLNRVHTGAASAGSCNGMTITWGYDAWANRKSQSASGGTCSIDQPSYTINNNNTISGFSYDASGNISTDANGNSFIYDAEGRIATVTSATTKYIYDAEGRRVAKENSGTGAVTNSYALSLGGDELAEFNINPNTGLLAWAHSNIFAMGRIYATYGTEPVWTTQTTRFHLNDWLGSRRIDLSPGGTTTLTCFNYPYGDGQACTGSDTDITEQHFTGKMRDTETGDDDFGARYYASNMGRFLTADEVRNDGNPANPQSWNLYTYVHNDPLVLVDPTGEASYDTSAAVAAEEDRIEQQNEDMDPATQEYASREGIQSLDQIAAGQQDALLAQQQNADPTLPTAQAPPLLSNQDIAGLKTGTEFALTVGIPDLGELGVAGKALSSVAEESVSVYQKAETAYVGITKNLAAREAQHGEGLVKVVGDLTRKQARGVEQAIIEQKGLANLTNKINSIAKTNPIYQEAVQFGRQLLKSIGFE